MEIAAQTTLNSSRRTCQVSLRRHFDPSTRWLTNWLLSLAVPWVIHLSTRLRTPWITWTAIFPALPAKRVIRRAPLCCHICQCLQPLVGRGHRTPRRRLYRTSVCLPRRGSWAGRESLAPRDPLLMHQLTPRSMGRHYLGRQLHLHRHLHRRQHQHLHQHLHLH